jgi:hypothetical protein
MKKTYFNIYKTKKNKKKADRWLLLLDHDGHEAKMHRASIGREVIPAGALRSATRIKRQCLMRSSGHHATTERPAQCSSRAAAREGEAIRRSRSRPKD